MNIRWYAVVVDCRDVAAQSRWWARALDWRVGFESDEEVILVPPHALDRARAIPLSERGPRLVRAWSGLLDVTLGGLQPPRCHIE